MKKVMLATLLVLLSLAVADASARCGGGGCRTACAPCPQRSRVCVVEEDKMPDVTCEKFVRVTSPCSLKKVISYVPFCPEGYTEATGE